MNYKEIDEIDSSLVKTQESLVNTQVLVNAVRSQGENQALVHVSQLLSAARWIIACIREAKLYEEQAKRTYFPDS